MATTTSATSPRRRSPSSPARTTSRSSSAAASGSTARSRCGSSSTARSCARPPAPRRASSTGSRGMSRSSPAVTRSSRCTTTPRAAGATSRSTTSCSAPSRRCRAPRRRRSASSSTARSCARRPARNSENLDWVSWDVAEFAGREASVRIVDNNRFGWGHVLVDQVMFSDAAAAPRIEGYDWLDWGRDDYATVSFGNAPDGRRVMLGWMNNWDYANDIPTGSWRSANTLPRDVRSCPPPRRPAPRAAGRARVRAARADGSGVHGCLAADRRRLRDAARGGRRRAHRRRAATRRRRRGRAQRAGR